MTDTTGCKIEIKKRKGTIMNATKVNIILYTLMINMMENRLIDRPLLEILCTLRWAQYCQKKVWYLLKVHHTHVSILLPRFAYNKHLSCSFEWKQFKQIIYYYYYYYFFFVLRKHYTCRQIHCKQRFELTDASKLPWSQLIKVHNEIMTLLYSKISFHQLLILVKPIFPCFSSRLHRMFRKIR